MFFFGAKSTLHTVLIDFVSRAYLVLYIDALLTLIGKLMLRRQTWGPFWRRRTAAAHSIPVGACILGIPVSRLDIFHLPTT